MMESKPMEGHIPGICHCGRGNRSIAEYGYICQQCHDEGWRAGKEMMGALQADPEFVLVDESADLVTEMNKLPKYIFGPDFERLWLTITTDVHGQWNIGYATVEGQYLEPYSLGKNTTLHEAAAKLSKVLEAKP